GGGGGDVEGGGGGLAAHAGGVGEVRGGEPETARLAAAAVAGRPVAAGAVLGEHRLSPRRGGRPGRQGLVADSRARRDVRGDRLDAGHEAARGSVLLEVPGNRIEGRGSDQRQPGGRVARRGAPPR